MHTFMGLGSKTFWFVGDVEDVNDPLQIGRAKVRAKALHSEDLNEIPTSDLPWATVLMPTTAGGGQGSRQSPGLDVGATVMGFFLDGAYGQFPIIIGILPGMNSSDSTAATSTPGQTRPGDGQGGDIPLPGDTTPIPGTNSGDASAHIPGLQTSKGVVNDPCVAFNYFIKQLGLTRLQSAAIVGNLMAESNLNTTANNGSDPGTGSNGKPGSWGIGQWNRIRRTNLEAFAARYNESYNSFAVQIAYVVQELTVLTNQLPNANLLAQLKAIKGDTEGELSRAVILVRKGYEAPAEAYARDNVRFANAKFVLGKCAVSSTGTSAGGPI